MSVDVSQFEFDADRVRKIALDEIERCLFGKRWNPAAHSRWISKITSNLFSQLAPNGTSRFKYAVHCMLSKRTVSTYDEFSNCLWDEMTDGIAVVDYENNDLRFSLVIWGVLSLS
jgi:hypothetical protein